MKPLTEIEKFATQPVVTANFKIPLPKRVTRYRELRRIGSFDHGIHRIYSYEIVNEEVLVVAENVSDHQTNEAKQQILRTRPGESVGRNRKGRHKRFREFRSDSRSDYTLKRTGK